MKNFYEILAPLVEGWTVAKVERGEGREGDPARLALKRGDATRTFEIWGGIYGPMISDVRDSKGDGPPLYQDVRQMFESIIDHAANLESYDGSEEPDLLEAIDDAMTRRFGFRCRSTGREWWVGLVTVKGSAYSQRFSTVEGRRALAARLSSCLL